jgi:hypothetical protein
MMHAQRPLSSLLIFAALLLQLWLQVAEEEVTAYTIDPLGYMIKRNKKKAEAEGRKVLTRPSRLDSFLPRFGGDDKKK